MTKPSEQEVSTAEMAEVLNTSARRLQKLAAGDWIAGRVAHGKWRLGETVQSYMAHLALSKRIGRDLSNHD